MPGPCAEHSRSMTGHLPLVMARQDPSNFKSKSLGLAFFIASELSLRPELAPDMFRGAGVAIPTIFPIYRTHHTAFAPHSQARSNASHTARVAQRKARQAQAPVFPAQPPRKESRQQSKAQTRSSRVRAPNAHAEKSRCASAPTRAVPPSKAPLPQPFSKVHFRNCSTFSAYP